MLHVFGDSQAKCLFDGVPGCKLNWLGPVTMYRVGRDKAWFLKEPDIAGGAWAVLVFGGIDVRCHIGRIAEETGSPRRAVVASLDPVSLMQIFLFLVCGGTGLKSRAW
jgi:hypothetical protein